MNCQEAIEKNICLGCNLAKYNINADDCEYRDRIAFEKCKDIIEQMKMEGLDDNKNSNAMQKQKK